MRIVIVEDNVSVAKGIAYRLRDDGHAVDLIHDGADADQFLRDDGGDVIVLDINLPGMDGIEVLNNLRTRGDMRPVLLLTARSETTEKIRGLDAGADDYLAKPFDLDEFSARIRALTRRGQAPRARQQGIGPLHFDAIARAIIGPEGPINAPRREVTVFETLLSAQGRTVSKQSLLDHLYGTGADVDEPVVEVYVSRLRKRLKPYRVEIRVHRGLGYCMQVSAT
ncbi:MAG: response regulator transcription factor [Alphaproteobacteria bacterium]|nr:response regulator transcription factor [Alphaproteobacteria bacterium]